jgi:hypothetical protein
VIGQFRPLGDRVAQFPQQVRQALLLGGVELVVDAVKVADQNLAVGAPKALPSSSTITLPAREGST